MWNKIKSIFLYIIRTIFLLSLIVGYFLSMDFWSKEINIDYGTGRLIGIIFACISLVQINNEQEEKSNWDENIKKMERYGMLKTETDREILSYINNKASEMNLTPEEYISEVKAYEEYQKNNKED